MKKLLLLVIVGVGLTSCTKDEFELESNYQFKMTGRTTQDINGYYHLKINPTENQQSLHRFGAYVTNFDKLGLPTQVIWRCDAFWYTPDTLGYTYIEIGNVPTGESPWSWENFAVTGYEGMTVPIVNGTSHADPAVDSVFYGQAWFEEGDVVLYDSINVIFE